MSEKKYSPEEVEKIKTRILESLEQVIDPELGIDIVNLGLIYDAMSDVPEVTKTEVKLVWYPAWTVEKMSRYARIALGIK